MKKVILLTFWNLFLSIPLFLTLSFRDQPSEYNSTAGDSIRKNCGKARIEVKMLVDTGVKNIDFTPRRKEVSDLVKFPKPGKISDKTPRLPAECMTYKLNCRILEYKKEDDGDYHLILQDISDTSIHMVAEIVDPKCEVARKSNYFKHFLFVREAFETCTLSKGNMKKGIYKIVGVAFYDKLHGAEGAAENGIELHPIIYFSKFK